MYYVPVFGINLKNQWTVFFSEPLEFGNKFDCRKLSSTITTYFTPTICVQHNYYSCLNLAGLYFIPIPKVRIQNNAHKIAKTPHMALKSREISTNWRRALSGGRRMCKELLPVSAILCRLLHTHQLLVLVVATITLLPHPLAFNSPTATTAVGNWWKCSPGNAELLVLANYLINCYFAV